MQNAFKATGLDFTSLLLMITQKPRDVKFISTIITSTKKS